MQDERDWGPIMALLAHHYGFGPWDVERLSERQVDMYLSQIGFLRLMDHMPQLQANFGQLNEEARLKLIAEAGQKPDPDSVDARAWRIFIRNYQTESEEAEQQAAAQALPLSQGAAAAFVQMIETGELTRDFALGSLWWRLKVLPIWLRLLATADQAAESPR